MKQITAILAFVVLGYAANAQSNDSYGNAADTSHRNHAYHNWHHQNGYDSLHKKGFRENQWRSGDQGYAFHRQYVERNRQHSFGNRERHGWGEMARMHFSPEQRKHMQDINKEYHKKAADLYKNDNMTLGAYKSQLLVLQKEKKNKIESLLTPEQKARMAESKKKRAENAQVMAAAHLERLKIDLKLNDEQVAKIKAQQEKMRSQMMAIRENENLLPYQKKEQMKGLIAKRRDEMKSVLTPDQSLQWEKMHKQHRFGERPDRNSFN